MATRPFSIDSPPAQPPEVSNRMGAVASAFPGQQGAAAPPPEPGAQGGTGNTQVMLEAVKRGLEQCANDPDVGEFIQRALAQVNAAIQAKATGAQGAQQGGPPGTSPEQAGGGGAPPGAMPPARGAGVAAGFPG